MTYITERIGEALNELIKRGWRSPIHAVTVAANGSMLGCKYEFDGDQRNPSCTILTEWYHPSGAFVLPINVMFTDSKGEAARVVIKGPEDKIEILN